MPQQKQTRRRRRKEARPRRGRPWSHCQGERTLRDCWITTCAMPYWNSAFQRCQAPWPLSLDKGLVDQYQRLEPKLRQEGLLPVEGRAADSSAK
jgi:hypothetical protein